MTVKESEIQKQLLEKRVGTLWEGTFTSSIVGFAAALFIYFYIREYEPAALINSWILLVFLFSSIRLMMAFVYRSDSSKYSLTYWDKLHFYLACSVGTLWGAVTYFLGNIPTEKEVVVVATLLGISSGGGDFQYC